MKKMAVLALAAVMALSLAACGSKASTETAETSEETSESESEATDEASTEDTEEESDGLEKIVFGTNAEFPPFEFVTTDGVLGEYDGIDMAIAAQIGEKLGCEVEVQNMEFDSLLVALQNGQVDATIAGMTVTEERAKSVDFSNPYYKATQVMIVPEDSDITCAADMDGKVIAVVQGYTGETCVKELGYEYEAFKKGTDCILELLNGKCDVVVIDSATAQKYIADNEGLKAVEDSSAFADEEYAIAVQKDNTELLDQINTVIDEMLSDGTISEISAQYIDEE